MGKLRRLFQGIECILALVEYPLVFSSGALNGWGGKAGRAACAGVAVIGAYALAYYLIACPATDQSWIVALLKAFEITLLVGYTKYASTSAPFPCQLLMASNMLLGLWWYTIFVPTVINRISRVHV
jgi:hypothetical protein